MFIFCSPPYFLFADFSFAQPQASFQMFQAALQCFIRFRYAASLFLLFPILAQRQA
jgi:hypothetical protein